jgi:D-lactate dehydrogenase (cytochrome)
MIYKTEKDEILDFFTDSSNYKGNCDGVYFPQSEKDIVEILKNCISTNQKITIAGNGTGLNGGRVPDNGISISTSQLNKIIEINEVEKYAIVETGVLLSDFQNEVESKGLFYPPDPTERNCYLGATVANNSSGAKTFKYGPTRDYVIGLRIVLPTGEILNLNRGELFARDNKLTLTTESNQTIQVDLPSYNMPSTKHAAGYFCKDGMDAIDLFIGSEGTLGLISEIKLKLISIPEGVLSSIIFFNKEDDALNFLFEARDLSNSKSDSKIEALGLEYFDADSLQYMKTDYTQIPENTQGAVWFEQEISAETEESILDEWMLLIEKHNGDLETAWIATNDSDRENFKDFRHAISWKITEYISQKNIRKVGTDTAVPNHKFYEYYKSAKQLVSEAGISSVCYGHFGDSHMHLNMLPEDSNQFDSAQNIYTKLMSKAVELGGTISAEHGIGKLKRKHMAKMFSKEDIVAMAKIKKKIDPHLLLNFGNIIDPKYFEDI